MKKLLFLSLLATAMLFAACGDSNDEAMPEEKDTAQQDVTGSHSNSTAVYQCDGSPIAFYYEPDTTIVLFDSPSQGLTALGFSIFTLHMQERIKEIHWNKGSEKFNEYAQYYGDTTYSEIHLIGHDYKVSAMPLNTITVTADKDFDAEHPAGASLNDLFVLQYASAYNLIKSGYDHNLDITYYYRDRSIDSYQTMMLSELESLNLPYLYLSLYFTKLPEKLGTYEFTITFNYGKDPISGREAKVAPAVVKAEFTEKDYVTLPKDKK